MAGLLADPEQVGIHDEDWIAAQQLKAFDEAAAIVHQRVPLVRDQDFEAAITRADALPSGRHDDGRSRQPVRPGFASASSGIIDRIGLPAIFTSGFGMVSVIGRMRVPRPAASHHVLV